MLPAVKPRLVLPAVDSGMNLAGVPYARPMSVGDNAPSLSLVSPVVQVWWLVIQPRVILYFEVIQAREFEVVHFLFCFS